MLGVVGHGYLVAIGRTLTAATAFGVLISHKSPWVFLLFSVLTATLQHVMRRWVVEYDSADQLLLIVWVGLSISYASKDIGLVLVAAHVLLAYAVSGIAKAFDPTWRSGAALSGLLSTVAHGSKIAAHAAQRPGVALVATWCVILFEITGPMMAMVSPEYGLAFVATAVVFHLCSAILMGLNNFLWAFAAALPSVLWASSRFA